MTQRQEIRSMHAATLDIHKGWACLMGRWRIGIAQKNAFRIGLLSALAMAATASPVLADQISFVNKFNAPGDVGGTTFARGIDGNGNIVGDYTDGSGDIVAFERFSNGTFSAPISEPNATGGTTQANEINSSGTIVGTFLQLTGGTSAFHGYLYNGGTFAQFDVGGSVSTNILGINNQGDFVGNFGTATQPNQSYMDIGGQLTKFTVFGAPTSNAESINGADQIVGVFTDAGGATHGYLRHPDGSLAAVDVPGSVLTEAFGINDLGVISGEYEVGNGTFYAFTDNNGVYASFSCPNSTSTLGRRINDADELVGQCSDPGGFTAQLSASVPEPNSILLLGVGLLALLLCQGKVGLSPPKK
jgi:hypothetical protein